MILSVIQALHLAVSSVMQCWFDQLSDEKLTVAHPSVDSFCQISNVQELNLVCQIKGQSDGIFCFK